MLDSLVYVATKSAVYYTLEKQVSKLKFFEITYSLWWAYIKMIDKNNHTKCCPLSVFTLTKRLSKTF